MELRIALCQCDIAWEQPARNLARLEPMVAAAEADVVLLPELFATGFTLDPAGVADGAGGAVVTALRRWADAGNPAARTTSLDTATVLGRHPL